MTIFQKYFAKLFFKQYSIGVTEGKIEDIIRQKKSIISFKWYNINHYNTSIADPFIVSENNNSLEILVEKFTTGELDGKICIMNYNTATGFSKPETIVNSDIHLSYPLVYQNADKKYVLLTELHGSLLVYEYDDSKKRLSNGKVLINTSLVDASILKYDNRYWIFGTLLDHGKSNRLYIYYSDHLFGQYQPHAGNPVKDNLDASRGAGSIFDVDGKYYRPSQNCSNYYGESITINKIVKLSPTEYEEEKYMVISPNKNQDFKFGIHTINGMGNFIVADGIKGHFQPVKQIVRAINRFLRKKVYNVNFFLYCLNNVNFEELAFI